ncbi:MAG: hypothetical protein ACRDUY_10805 [Nitriliruptorales bacterium]
MSSREIIRFDDGRTWTPAQILALVLGVVFIVLGGVALVRTGLSESLIDPTTTVAGLSYTPLLGIVEVVFGLLMLTVGAFPRAPEAVVFLGVLALSFGLLLVIEPAAFDQALAAGRGHGWFYVLTGGVAAVIGLMTPAFVRRGIGVTRGGGRPVGRRRTTPPRETASPPRRSTTETQRIDEDTGEPEAAGPRRS